MPFPYVLEGLDMSALDGIAPNELARYFPATELAEIGDEIADGLFLPNAEGVRPLALLDGLRTDFSLARLKHYTGTPPEHVRSEEHTSELQSLMRTSYAVFHYNKKTSHQ